MLVKIYGDNVKINEKAVAKIEEKLGVLSKYLLIDPNTTATVMVKDYVGELKIEVSAPSKIGILRSEIMHDDLDTGIELAIEKLEDKIRRQKSRLSRRHKDSLAESFIAEEIKAEDEDEVVRTKTVIAEEMEIDEAIMQMNLLDHDFFVYHDIDSNTNAVVYRRREGGYGLLEIK
ncbi:MAG: ribosome-associated translation inhibitor RaiA [Erysipelotrichaceae bacterium]|nr:ribosome-associated translation inhibitor RaiA [Erysipelotrichaceae bacterium]